MAKHSKKVRLAIRIVGFTLAGLALFYLVSVRPNPFFNQKVVPKIITSNFIDLDRVYEISKYRSGAGHDYASDGETCRSMKHYFNHGTYGVRTKPTASEPNINIYAPFNGIMLGGTKEHVGTQVQIVSIRNPLYDVRFFHIDIEPSLHFGSYVRSGQKIGIIGPRDGTDVSLESSGTGPGQHTASVFLGMTDEAFAPYAKMGFIREDFIISKEYRDAHPFACEKDREFKHTSDHDRREDLVYLRPNPNDPAPQGPGAPGVHYGPPAR